MLTLLKLIAITTFMRNFLLPDGTADVQLPLGGPTNEQDSFVEGGVLISYHCPMFPSGTVVGRFVILTDNSVRQQIHPDIQGIPLDKLHLYGIEVIKIDSSI